MLSEFFWDSSSDEWPTIQPNEEPSEFFSVLSYDEPAFKLSPVTTNDPLSDFFGISSSSDKSPVQLFTATFPEEQLSGFFWASASPGESPVEVLRATPTEQSPLLS